MIGDYLQAFINAEVPAETGYRMENIIICPSATNLIYEVRLVKSIMPFTPDASYSDRDILTLFEKALNRAIATILFYGCEYIFNHKNQTYKISFQFEEMKFYQKRRVFFSDVKLKTSKLYDEVSQYIKNAGSDGRTLNDLSYKFFRNHRNKQSFIINQLEESGDFLITKIAGLSNKPKTVFIAIAKNE